MAAAAAARAPPAAPASAAKPAISARFKDLKAFLQSPRVVAAEHLQTLERADFKLFQLPMTTVEDLQAEGLLRGTAKRIVEEAAKFAAE